MRRHSRTYVHTYNVTFASQDVHTPRYIHSAGRRAQNTEQKHTHTHTWTHTNTCTKTCASANKTMGRHMHIHIDLHMKSLGKHTLKPVCLIGAPGTGSSSAAASIAKILKQDFLRLSMAAVDNKYIRGYSSTYVNSKPGIIIERMSKLRYNSPVILLEEIDKIPIRSSPLGVLMDLFQLSCNFTDHSLGIQYMQSPPSLRSRFTAIRTPSYTAEKSLQ